MISIISLSDGNGLVDTKDGIYSSPTASRNAFDHRWVSSMYSFHGALHGFIARTLMVTAATSTEIDTATARDGTSGMPIPTTKLATTTSEIGRASCREREK